MPKVKIFQGANIETLEKSINEFMNSKFDLELIGVPSISTSQLPNNSPTITVLITYEYRFSEAD